MTVPVQRLSRPAGTLKAGQAAGGIAARIATAALASVSAKPRSSVKSTRTPMRWPTLAATGM